MKKVLLGLVVMATSLLGGCVNIGLDLNINPSVSQMLPKEIAVNYLTEINTGYPANDGNCKFSENFWQGSGGGKFAYNSSFMTYESTMLSWSYYLVIKLKNEKNGVTDWCYIVDIKSSPQTHRKLTIDLYSKIVSKVSTALKSLGVKVEVKR